MSMRSVNFFDVGLELYNFKKFRIYILYVVSWNDNFFNSCKCGELMFVFIVMVGME